MPDSVHTRKLSRRTALKGGAPVALAATVPTVGAAGDGELWTLWEQCDALNQEAGRLFSYDGPLQ